MHDFLQFWLNEFSRSENPQHVNSVLTRAAATLGYEYAAYGMRRPFPISNPQILMVSNYPDRWQERYIEARFANVDSAVKAALGSDRPVTWSASTNASKSAFWAEALSFGIAHGWSSASRGADGTIGVLSLSRRQDAIDTAEKFRNESIVHWLANVAHASMAPFLPAADEFDPDLTRRETDVLKWTADGKTAYEIALILSISESTVNFHVKNIVSKLGSTNKIQAVAKAALMGML
ncbi:N-acyl-homoserine lactone dependent regulator BpsR2 [Burkholderia thailandensis]|uniref:Autoinducer-binding transcriptional regulator, LuxR family n=2 Tax=Burkholderia thailandensis TaxID=57975 RepID=Q2T5X2_BURTA|nr:N-acyl-homoserine lactone dependent regulator BpsR2 [Burkholderia thailandensis]ABC34774.1 autoinducer-binding transcriptional regulator, LuxR family [Burkholderia thailandensis E264]AHI68044.1 bacterial regulatory s, luxR family protein [Burkholderia thailandensis H0587]AHI75917.1 bacterial regulatory s, luxR family protein [Burkholderia thailandensis 2002721723]AHI81988.1 bacterial regulatory s, luxR family protein [Burkholderia thailandensis E444]AIC91126.1 bacterial regulatory s, luxR f